MDLKNLKRNWKVYIKSTSDFFEFLKFALKLQKLSEIIFVNFHEKQYHPLEMWLKLRLLTTDTQKHIYFWKALKIIFSDSTTTLVIVSWWKGTSTSLPQLALRGGRAQNFCAPIARVILIFSAGNFPVWLNTLQKEGEIFGGFPESFYWKL